MYKCILCATDLRKMSRNSITKALQVAKAYDAELFLVHIIEPMHAYGPGGMVIIDEASYIDDAWRTLTQFTKPYNIPETHQLIEVGPIKRSIIRTAQKLNADLIIMGHHERSGLTRLLGSVAEAVVQGFDRDVLMVRTPLARNRRKIKLGGE